MKEILGNFLNEFSSLSTEEQVEIFNQIKRQWKEQLQLRGKETEQKLNYLKDVFKSEFPEPK